MCDKEWVDDNITHDKEQSRLIEYTESYIETYKKMVESDFNYILKDNEEPFLLFRNDIICIMLIDDEDEYGRMHSKNLTYAYFAVPVEPATNFEKYYFLRSSDEITKEKNFTKRSDYITFFIAAELNNKVQIVYEKHVNYYLIVKRSMTNYAMDIKKLKQHIKHDIETHYEQKELPIAFYTQTFLPYAYTEYDLTLISSKFNNDDLDMLFAEAIKCYEYNLYTAASATLFIGLEQMLKIILIVNKKNKDEKDKEKYIKKIEEKTLNQLLDLVNGNKWISKPCYKRLIAVKSMRNTITHNCDGIITSSDFSSAISAIRVLMKELDKKI